MREFHLTYTPIDTSKPNLKTYVVNCNNKDEAVDAVIPMILRDYPGIDLQKDYNPFPQYHFRDLP